jgi:hypothetical protein
MGSTIPRTIRSPDWFPSRLHPIDPRTSNPSIRRRQDESQGMSYYGDAGGLFHWSHESWRWTRKDLLSDPIYLVLNGTETQTLPGIYLLISNVLVIVFGPSPYILVQFGFFVAWVYLRFFKLSENGEFRGDRSETFAFQYWFPPPIRYVLSFICLHLYVGK